MVVPFTLDTIIPHLTAEIYALAYQCLTGQPVRRKVVPSALAYLFRSSTGERLGNVVGRVASLERYRCQ